MRLFNNTPEQQNAIIGMMQDLGRQLIAITFSDPATDQQVIRHQVYLRGKFDMLKTIFEDEFEAPELPNKPEGQ